MDFIDVTSPERPGSKEPTSYNLTSPESSTYNIPTDYEVTGGGGNQDPSSGQPDLKTGKSIWSIEFYQKYFDVNTDEVVNRVLWSMLPTPNVNFLQHFIQNKPDLYGPFWICVTLVFAIGISGNLSDYFQSPANRNYPWKYDFHAVSLAGVMIFLYAWCLPLILWGALQWSSVSEVKLRLIELICTYGYAMAIYVPLSALWIVPVAWIQWLLTLVGALLSGSVLCISLRPAFSKTGYTILVLLFIMHLLIATCFMRFFFHVSKYHPIVIPSDPVIVPTTPQSALSPQKS